MTLSMIGMTSYGYGHGMYAGDGAEALIFTTWLVWTVVGVLLAIWLWRKISKKD